MLDLIKSPMFLVFAGGGSGALLRYWVQNWMRALLGPNLPYDTFLINLSGSTIMGILTAILLHYSDRHWPEAMRLLLATGVLGGYTTFSAFSLDVVQLVELQRWAAAGVYLAASVVLSILACFAGLSLTKFILS